MQEWKSSSFIHIPRNIQERMANAAAFLGACLLFCYAPPAAALQPAVRVRGFHPAHVARTATLLACDSSEPSQPPLQQQPPSQQSQEASKPRRAGFPLIAIGIGLILTLGWLPDEVVMELWAPLRNAPPGPLSTIADVLVRPIVESAPGVASELYGEKAVSEPTPGFFIVLTLAALQSYRGYQREQAEDRARENRDRDQ